MVLMDCYLDTLSITVQTMVTWAYVTVRPDTATNHPVLYLDDPLPKA